MSMRLRQWMGPTPPSRWREEEERDRKVGTKVMVRGILEEQ